MKEQKRGKATDKKDGLRARNERFCSQSILWCAVNCYAGGTASYGIAAARRHIPF